MFVLSYFYFVYLLVGAGACLRVVDTAGHRVVPSCRGWVASILFRHKCTVPLKNNNNNNKKRLDDFTLLNVMTGLGWILIRVRHDR